MKINILLKIILLVSTISLYSDSITYQSERPVIVHFTTKFDETSLSNALNNIKAAESIDSKIEILKRMVNSSPEGFTSEQVIQILNAFDYDLPMEEAIDIINSKIYGLSNDDIESILKEFKVEKIRLKVLTLLSASLYEDIDQEKVLNLFKNKNNKEKVNKLIESFHKRSPIFGNIEGKNIIFMIDCSGSMAEKFKTNDESEISRFQYLIQELSFVLENHVKSNMKFNIIIFNDKAIKWQPNLVKVSKTNSQAAIQFLSGLEPAGGTNIENAINSEVNKDIDTVYILSDGIDNPSKGFYKKLGSYKNKIRFNTINFLMGKNESEEIRSSAKKILYDISKNSGGVLRVIE